MATEFEVLSSSATFTWKIKDFSKLNAHEGAYSQAFFVGSYQWKVHIFPKGRGEVYEHVSLFLEAVAPTEYPYVECRFSINSQTNRLNSVRYEFKCKLTEAGGWGFRKFMRLSELHDPAKGYIVDDTCVVRIDVSCRMNEEPIEDDA